MRDEEKTKSQLIKELIILRKLVDELEKLLPAREDKSFERKHTGKALKKPEQRAIDSIDSSYDAIFAVDSEGKVISWHKEMEKLTGVRAEELLGKGNYEYALPFYGVRRPMLIDLILKPDVEIREEDYHYILKEGDAFIAEAYVVLRGKPRAIWAKARPLYDGRGNVTGAIESIHDITERKLVEDSLKESEIKYQEVVENINDVIYTVDQNGHIVYISPVVKAAFGYHQSELIGCPFTDVVFPEDTTIILENLQIVEAGHVSPSEFRIYKKSGEICWVRTSSRLKSEKGHVTFHGVLTDITERKYAEELYKTLANSSQAGVYIARDGKILFVNPHIPRYSGFSEKELIGMDVLNIVHHEDRDLVRKNAIDMLKGIRSAPYEFRMIDSNGQIRSLMGTVTPITYEGKPAVLGNTMEIVEQKRA
jgi:PAS domain S-box-containing protein